MEKVSKESVLYIYRPETQVQCKECVFSKTPDKCAVLGQTESIDPLDSCGVYIHSTDPKLREAMPWLGLLTKIEVGYAINRPGFTCKRCEYFLGMDCQKVDKNSKGDTPGIIHPNACCNAWEADSKRSKITTEEFQAAGKSSWYRQLLRKSG